MTTAIIAAPAIEVVSYCSPDPEVAPEIHVFVGGEEVEVNAHIYSPSAGFTLSQVRADARDTAERDDVSPAAKARCALFAERVGDSWLTMDDTPWVVDCDLSTGRPARWLVIREGHDKPVRSLATWELAQCYVARLVEAAGLLKVWPAGG